MAYIHLKKGRDGEICGGGSIYYLKSGEEDGGKGDLSFVMLDLKERESEVPGAGKSSGDKKAED